jgi:hypothetical protein
VTIASDLDKALVRSGVCSKDDINARHAVSPDEANLDAVLSSTSHDRSDSRRGEIDMRDRLVGCFQHHSNRHWHRLQMRSKAVKVVLRKSGEKLVLECRR